MIIIDNMRQ